MVQYLEKIFQVRLQGERYSVCLESISANQIYISHEGSLELPKSAHEEIASSCNFGSFCRHHSHPITRLALLPWWWWSWRFHHSHPITHALMLSALHPTENASYAVIWLKIALQFLPQYLPDIYETVLGNPWMRYGKNREQWDRGQVWRVSDLRLILHFQICNSHWRWRLW